MCGASTDARTNAGTHETEIVMDPMMKRPAIKRAIVHLIVAVCAAGLVRADQTTQSVQQALKEQGFYYGNVTGDKSAETTAAIRRYQIRNGLQVTGEIDPETLRSLNVNSKSVSSPQRISKSAITKFKHGKWKVKWKKLHREDADEYGLEERERDRDSWSYNEDRDD